jgi:gliding motility-associated-like protein
MKNFILSLVAVVFSSVAFSQGGPTCSEMEPICTDVGLSFTANSGIPQASTTDPGNNYSCLITQPNPTWYYFEIATSGNINMNLTANSDIDYIIWGPFNSLSEAQNQCGNLGTPSSEIVSCSFSPTNNEFPNINGAVAGQVYVMLITNYADVVQDVSLVQIGGLGSTDCSIVTNPPCGMVALNVAVSGCNTTTNQYGVTGSIEYVNPPTTGNLTVVGCNGVPQVVATAPFGPGPINFNLGSFAANGASCNVTAFFSADPTCTQSFSYTAPLCLANCPTYDLQSFSPTVACGNQMYNLEINNSGCDGYIEFNVLGNWGSIFANELAWQVTSNLTGNVVASGGPGVDGANFNVSTGQLDLNTQGAIYTLEICDFSIFGDGFNGTGGFITVQANGLDLIVPITSFFGCQTIMFQAPLIVSTSTLTVQTPSGFVSSQMGNCNDHNVQFMLNNTNFCTPIQVELPWEITCDITDDLIASGTHTVIVYPQVPDQSTDLVSVTWNTTTCSWDVSPNNDCDEFDLGSIFTISPDPAGLSNYCSNGNQNFSVNYLGVTGSPDCCATAGPSAPITYAVTETKPNAVVTNSPFGGVNNAAYIDIAANGTGGDATSLNLTVSYSGYCENISSTTGDNMWVTVYVDGFIIYDQLSTLSNFSQSFTLADLPYGYNENSVIEVYYYPNQLGSTVFAPNTACGSLLSNQWNVSGFNVALSVVFEQEVGTPVICTLPAAPAYTCCTVAPLTANAPANVTVDCPSAVPAINTASVVVTSSDCPTTTAHISDVPTGTCPSSIARTYRVTDACGNFVNVVQTITINPPTVLMPSNGSNTVSCPSQASGHTVPTVLDNCGRTLSVSAPVVTPDPICEGSKTYTYTYTDCFGTTYPWTFTYTIDYSGGLTAPSSTSSTVSCPSQAIAPAAPANITDACGRTVVPVLIGQDGPTPVCEGTVVWRYRYTACDGTTTADWTHTYTIDYSGGLTPPSNTSSTVSCPANAVAPAAPANITDACGRTVVPVLIGQDAPTPACEGTVVWRYRYTACDGTTTADWTHTYTIDYSGGLTAPASTSSTVTCPADAVAPSAPANITDACGRTVVPVLIGQDAPTPACEGTVVWRYRYTACDGTTTADWTHTYTIDYSGALSAPASTSSTVSCPSQASAPSAPANITDACGRTVVPVLIGQDAPTPTCEGTVVWRYRYTACDGTTTVDWTHTYTIDYSGGLTAPASTSSTVSCPSQAIVPTAPANITDACGRTVVPVLIGQDGPTPACEGTVVWRYRYTACDGTTSVDWTHTYTIDLTTGPTEVGGPVSVASTINCASAAVVPATLPNIQDACGNILSPLAGSPVVGGTYINCEGTITYTYNYQDCAGNPFTWTYTYTIDLPAFTIGFTNGSSTVACPSDATDPGAPGIVTDACGNTLTPVITAPSTVGCSGGTMDWVYTYTDCAGNTAAWTYSYNVTLPAFTITALPGSSTVNCLADAQVQPTPPSVQDACGNAIIPTVVAPANIACEGNMVWTFNYEDCGGNTASWTYTYTIDIPAFTISTLPGASTVNCLSDAQVQPSAPVIQDACGNTLTPVVVAPSAIACEGNMIWTFNYTDCAGNTASWTHTYTIDIPAFSISNLPGTSTVNCSADALVQPSAPVVQDACGNTLTPTVVAPTAIACEGNMVWTFNYIDCAGNTASWTHTYSIDIPAFTITALPGTSTVNCSADALVQPSAPVVQDACGNTLTPTVVAPTAIACEGNMVWTFNYSDCAGNTASWTYTYTIDLPAFAIGFTNGASTVACPSDATDPGAPGIVTDACGNTLTPVITAPSTVGCSGGTMDWVYTYTDCAGNTAAWTYSYNVTLPAFTITALPGSSTVNCLADAQVQPTPPSVQDACGNAIIPTVVAPTNIACEGNMVWTFNYEDCGGNTASWTYTYTIDIPAFTISDLPGASTVNCLSDAQVQPSAPVVQDACGNTLTPVVAAPSAIACEGNMIWTFNYTDCAGNTASWTHTYTIDIPAFTISNLPGTSTVNCSADALVQPSAPVVQDACGNTLTPTVVAPMAIACEGNMVWTFNYVDCAGNTASWTHTYTIDIPAFTISYPNGSSTVACPSDATDPGAPGVVTDVCGNTLTPVVTAPSTVGCSGGTMDWVYTYTDCAGNTADWTYSYNVSLPAFTITDLPGSSSVNCLADAQVQPTPPSVQDACGNTIVPTVVAPANIACEGDMVWTFNYEDCGGNTASWIYTYTIDIQSFTISEPNGTSTVSCLAEAQVQPTPPVVQDACGNLLTPVVVTPADVVCEGEMEWIFNFEDCAGNLITWKHKYIIDAPQLNVPTDVTVAVSCIDEITTPTGVAISDLCGNSINPVMTEGPDPVCSGQKIYTFTYENCAGETFDCQHIFEVNDNVPPVAQSMDTIYLQVNEDVPAANTGSVVATDNCSSTPTVIFVGDASDNQKCPETITRTYRVADDCGNYTDVVQYIVINSGCEIVIPTAFSPNGDQMNDVWEIVDIDDVYPNNLVTVYNRWGNMIFESNKGDYSSKMWDGKFNGELLPVGSYYYIILTEGDNSGEIFKGTVSIIKN